MSCACDFPQPSLRCVVQLIRAARAGEPQGEIIKRALCLAGGLVDAIPSSCESDVQLLGEDLAELLEQAEQVCDAHLDEGDDVAATEVDGQIWEILLPILIPIAIDLLKAWLERRQGGKR